MSKKSLDPRVLRTRRLLRDALLGLLQERRFDLLTIQDITDRAMLNRATFYLHYRDKLDLLLNAMQDVLDELALLPVPLNPQNPQELAPERLQNFFVELFRHVAKHAVFYRIMLNDGSLSDFVYEIQAFVHEYGTKWMSRARSPSELKTPIDIITNTVAGAYLGLIRWWLNAGMPHTPDYMGERFMRLVLPGILAAIED